MKQLIFLIGTRYLWHVHSIFIRLLYVFFACCLYSALSCSEYEHNIIVIIPSYNNIQWYERNVRSAITQKYRNFEIIYIDDCSQDGTGEAVERYIASAQNACPAKITLIKNTQRHGALANLYTTIHACHDEAIIVVLDGDDWFAHDRVLTIINSVYKGRHVWLTYGQHRLYPSKRRGICKPYADTVVNANAYREEEWLASHVRTFYAGLFKHIKLEDLLYESAFFPMAWDLACMLPMLEMAGGNYTFINDILYIYNNDNVLNDHKINEKLQVQLAGTIRSRPRYKKLADFRQQEKQTRVDLIVISHDSPEPLKQFLESITYYKLDFSHIFVLYTPTLYPWYADLRTTYEKEYSKLQQLYKGITFINVTQLKDALMQCVAWSHEYIVLAQDTLSIKSTVNIIECAQLLAQTYAYGFYMSLDKSSIQQSYVAYIRDNICAWQFGQVCPAIAPLNFNFTLYRKETIQQALNISSSFCFSSFKEVLGACIYRQQAGLSFVSTPIEQESLWKKE